MRRKLITIMASAMLMAFAISGCKEVETFNVNELKGDISGASSDDEEVATKEPTNITDTSEKTVDNNVNVDNNNDKQNNVIETVVFDVPPFDYYVSENVIVKENQGMKLELKVSKPNLIIDEQEWFMNNNLTMFMYSGFEIPKNTEGSIPEGLDDKWYEVFSTKAFHDEEYIYSIYGKDYSEGYLLAIYDAETLNMVYAFDLSEYRYAPENITKEYEFIQQKINWAKIKDNVLYVSHSHKTYAKSSNNMNGYIVAINLSDMSILWRSNPLVDNCNNFTIIDDVILCGYGFTDEKDYLYQIDVNNGKILDKILLKSAPIYIAHKDDTIYVRTYNTDYEFEIKR